MVQARCYHEMSSITDVIVVVFLGKILLHDESEEDNETFFANRNDV